MKLSNVVCLTVAAVLVSQINCVKKKKDDDEHPPQITEAPCTENCEKPTEKPVEKPTEKAAEKPVVVVEEKKEDKKEIVKEKEEEKEEEKPVVIPPSDFERLLERKETTRWMALVNNKARATRFVVTGGSDYFVLQAEALSYLVTHKEKGLLAAIYASLQDSSNDHFDVYATTAIKRVATWNYDSCQMKWSSEENAGYNYLKDFAAEAKTPSSPSSPTSMGGNLGLEACEVDAPLSYFEMTKAVPIFEGSDITMDVETFAGQELEIEQFILAD